MNRLMQWVLAATLICGSTMFTSCSKDDNPVNPADNLAEKIIGKWIMADMNGQPLLTNDKTVLTFLSPTKAYGSTSLLWGEETMTYWFEQIEIAVAIDGNKMVLTCHANEHHTAVEEYTVTAIDDTEFTANLKLTVKIDDKVVVSSENTFRFTRVTRDYSEQILGLWECKGLKGDETFNDGNDRLEFFEDGTYNYWRKNETGEWESVTSTREFQEYFVDGTLLATRWKNIDEGELREWWEIKSVKGDKMQWKALRANDDGTTFEQVMDWEKVVE